MNAKTLRVAHIYGTTVLHGQYCPVCQVHAFVVRGEMACCGRTPTKVDHTTVKVEVDKVGARRKRPSWWQRQEILRNQNNRCLYCDVEFGVYQDTSRGLKLITVQWDHFRPFSYDGNNDLFVAACGACNQAKRNILFDSVGEAKAYIRKKRGL